MFLITFLLIASQPIGLGKTYPWSLLPFHLGRLFWLGSTFCLLGLLFGQFFKQSPLHQWTDRIEKQISILIKRREWLVALVIGNIAFALLNFFKFKNLGYQYPYLSLLVCLGFLPFITQNLFKTILFHLCFFGTTILHFPLIAERSDMLPAIQNSLNLWWNGNEPYQLVTLGTIISGTPYLPGTLFSHFPAWSLGLDLRWGQWLFRAVWMGLVFKQLQKTSADHPVRDLTSFFLLNPFLLFRHDLYFDFYILLLCVYSFFPKGRIVTIPLIAMTTQWGWVLVPYMVIRELWLSSKTKITVKVVSLSASFLSVFFIAFLLLRKTTSWKNLSEMVLFANALNSTSVYQKDYGFTLAPLEYALGLQNKFFLIQATICVVLFMIFIFRSWKANNKEREDTFLLTSFGTTILFTLTSLHFWNYFWFFSTSWMLFCLIQQKKTEATRLY